MKRPDGVWILAAVGLWLAASVGLKADRYGSPPAPRQERTEASVERFMEGLGWEAAGSRNITSDGHYKAALFRLPGCRGAVATAVLGRGNESVEAVRGVLGSDMAYLFNGLLAPEPQQSALTQAALIASGLQAFGGPRDRVPGILAIAPAPRADGSRCGGPTPDEWGGFTRTLD